MAREAAKKKAIPLERDLVLRQMTRRVLMVVALGTMAVAGAVALLSGEVGIDASRLHRGVVREVVSEREFVIEIEMDQTVRVRLLGVGRWADVSGADMDKIASLVVNQAIDIDANVSGEAYLYRSSDGLFINETLVERGLAPTDRDATHRLSGWFERLEDRARRSKRGHGSTGGSINE